MPYSQQRAGQEAERCHQPLSAVPWPATSQAEPALSSPTAFRWQGEVLEEGIYSYALLAVFDLCHTVILGSCGPEVLCELLCCAHSLPHRAALCMDMA